MRKTNPFSSKSRVINLSNSKIKQNQGNVYYTGPVKRLYSSIKYPTNGRYGQDSVIENSDILVAGKEMINKFEKETFEIKQQKLNRKEQFEKYLRESGEIQLRDSIQIQNIKKEDIDSHGKVKSVPRVNLSRGDNVKGKINEESMNLRKVGSMEDEGTMKNEQITYRVGIKVPKVKRNNDKTLSLM